MCIIFFENDKFSSSANPIYMYIYKQHERSLLAMKCAVIFVSKKIIPSAIFCCDRMCHIYFVFMSRTKPCQVPNSTDNDLVKLNVHFKSTNRLDACCLYIAIFRSRIRFVEININQILSQACAKLFLLS